MTASAVGADEAVRQAARLAARDILDRGYAVVRLSDVDAASVSSAISTAVEFFDRPEEEKRKHGSDDHNYGYRPFGIEYSITPDRPDMNEVFTLWSDRMDLIPNVDDIPELTAGFLAWRDMLAPLVAATLDEVARECGADSAPAFERASYLQINHYVIPAPPERDMLQDKHEDGHMVTVLHANAPGLEIYSEGEHSDVVTPVLPAPNEVVLMPGSVLTALSGGRVQPMFHQVRNHSLDSRQSIMYFVNPEIDRPVLSWVADADGTRADVREHVTQAPAMFGLPPVEAL